MLLHRPTEQAAEHTGLSSSRWCRTFLYRVHNTTGDDLGLLQHPAPNIEPGDVVVLSDGRVAIVTAARVEAQTGDPMQALLEIATSDEIQCESRWRAVRRPEG